MSSETSHAAFSRVFADSDQLAFVRATARDHVLQLRQFDPPVPETSNQLTMAAPAMLDRLLSNAEDAMVRYDANVVSALSERDGGRRELAMLRIEKMTRTHMAITPAVWPPALRTALVTDLIAIVGEPIVTRWCTDHRTRLPWRLEPGVLKYDNFHYIIRQGGYEVPAWFEARYPADACVPAAP